MTSSAPSEGRLLNRAQDSRPAAPVRIVHMGLGNFFRAHQAYYTETAPDAGEWGIAAFTGRSGKVAEELAPQEGLYNLIVQHPDRNEYQIIGALSAVHAANDLDAWRKYMADPQVAIVTSTVTEAGYVRNKAGGLDTDNPGVIGDIEGIKADGKDAEVATAPGKMVAGLLGRRAANAGPITFCPCDNIPDNGEMVERVVRDLAQIVDPTLVEWIDENVGFVTTMVDRITPRATAEDLAAVLADTGIDDVAAVTTEPFIEWVLAGEFKNGRPAWDAAGAVFADDITPFETRKLWLLNGSHSLMAYAATILGHETVYDAINDPTVRGWVEEWWDVAARHLTLPAEEIVGAREALIDRYNNPRIRHLLAQIAADGSQKIAIRHVPALTMDRAQGQMPYGATRAVAAWTLHLRGLGAPVTDALAGEVSALVTGSLEESVNNVLAYLKVDDPEVASVVLHQAEELETMAKGA
ncbi:MAG: mannitol dehydrogenase family protein [Dermatophilus congolensis]|nr:mannitol dehydrogenase family protein [Dermatophilus congolensis]